LPNVECFRVVTSLIGFLSVHFKLHHSREDLNKIMQLYKMDINYSSTMIPKQFLSSCKWAQLV